MKHRPGPLHVSILVFGTAGCGGAPVAVAPLPARAPFRFEIADQVRPPCPDFWAAPAYPPGTSCARARGALQQIYETPESDEAAALQALDWLCTGGLVDACDVGRELLWSCAVQLNNGERPGWTRACDVLRSAGRKFPPISGKDWVDIAFPAYLSGCHVVQAERTCDDVTTFLDPNRGPTCAIDPSVCPGEPDPTGRRVELFEDAGIVHARCVDVTLPVVQVGAVHCFDGSRWLFRGPGGPWRAATVTWRELRGMEAVGAWHGSSYEPVLTVEGTGDHPVLRIGWTRAWLRKPAARETRDIGRELEAFQRSGR